MISLRQVTVRQGTFALENVSLEVPRGEYGVLMGKTGSGKTTLLEALCGLRRIHSGSIWLMDREVTALRPAARGLGYVPQDAALFSTLTVLHITHNRAEAECLADRMFELRDGAVRTMDER